MTEVRAGAAGVIWLGEDDDQMAVIHSKRAAVALRGRALERWKEDGQQKWIEERVVTVVIGSLRLVSVYQPIWGTDDIGIEECRKAMEDQLAMGGGKTVIIGGDLNASVGKGRGRQGVYGKEGIGRMNDAGRDLMDWCEKRTTVREQLRTPR